MIQVDVCDGEHVEGDVAPERIKEFLEKSAGSKKPGAPRTTLWADVTDPSEEDWRVLTEQFHFHPLAIEDAQQQGQRSKMDTYEGYLFLSIHAWQDTPVNATDSLQDVTCEIDIFVGPNFLVTIHQDEISAISETRKRWEKHSRHIGLKPAYLLYLLLDAVVDAYFPAMDAIDDETEKIEDAIYNTAGSPDSDTDHDTGLVTLPNLRPALGLKRRLLLLRQAVSPLRDVLNALMRTDDPDLMPTELRVYYQDVYDHALRLVEQVDLHRDILGGVMDSMMAQVSNRIAETSNRLNQVMKRMTAISTILMSAALVSGIYGMNFHNMPELGWHYGYFYALGFMALLSFSLFAYFKKIRWF